MGIEYSAKLIVGLPYEGFSEFFGDDVAGDCYEKGLEYVSPYYDAEVDHWVIGVGVAKSEDYDWNYVDAISDRVVNAHVKFTEITGLTGKLILSPHGY